MSKRSRKPTDPNLLATAIVGEATKPVLTHKNLAAVELGKLGGKKGGPARAKSLTAKQRQEIAKKAANARWQKHKKRD